MRAIAQLPAIIALRDHSRQCGRCERVPALVRPAVAIPAKALRPILPDNDDYRWANNQHEYRVALIQCHLEPRPGRYARSAPGEFIGTSPFGGRQWVDGQLLTEADFRATAGQAGDEWPWWAVVGGPAGMDTTLTGLREELARMVQYG